VVIALELTQRPGRGRLPRGAGCLPRAPPSHSLNFNNHFSISAIHIFDTLSFTIISSQHQKRLPLNKFTTMTDFWESLSQVDARFLHPSNMDYFDAESPGNRSRSRSRSTTSATTISRGSKDDPIDPDSGPVRDLTTNELVEGTPGPEVNGAAKASSNPATPRYDPATLLSPAGKRPRDPEPVPGQRSDFANGSAPGMTSLIERMHRVENNAGERKRAKTMDEEEGEEKKKHQFKGMGTGGPIGEYLQEKRQDNTANGASLPHTIDLTVDDDDDVILTSVQPAPSMIAADDRVVCLGRLADAKVNASLVPTPRMGQFQGSSAMWAVMKCTLHREKDGTVIIKVKDPSLRHIGNIDFPTAKVLCPLMDSAAQNGVRVSARLAPRHRKSGEIPGRPTSLRLDIFLILYAPNKNVLGIGNYLKKQHLLLLDPPPGMVDRGYEVVNPHAPPKSREQAEQASTAGGYGTPGSSGGFVQRSVEQIRSEVVDMFDSLTNTEELPEKEQSNLVITPLLKHQKQALYFLSEVEKDRGFLDDGDESERFSLWRVRYDGIGQKTFYNVITGHEQRQRPPPVLGGILADMMGLGKTLSILSLIVDSLPQAAAFSLRGPPSTPLRLFFRNLKGTLLIAPMSTIQNWEEQIRNHISPGTLSVCVHHGTNRTQKHQELAKYDIVLTSYGTLASEYSRYRANSPLLNCQWFRMVLDEAHVIRAQNTQQFRACQYIVAERRIAVTGTPVQNRLDDLGALIKFLRITPFDETSAFNQFIMQPFKNADTEIIPKLRLLVDSITLRRMKDKIDLPKRDDLTVRLDFSQEEQRLYQFFLNDSTKRVKAVTTGSKLGGKSYAHILKAILRLRQICAHGEELLNEEDLKMTKGLTAANAIELGDDDDDDERPSLTQKQAFEMFYLLRESDMDRCSVCQHKIGRQAIASDSEDSDSSSEEEASDIVGHMTPCYQIVCSKCIGHFSEQCTQMIDLNNPEYMFCPLCTQYVRLDFFEIKQSELDEDALAKERVRQNPRLAKQLGRYNGPHTKTKALIEELRKHQEWSDANPHEKPIKSVIFSGWTSHLDLIQRALEDNRFKYTRLDGSMSRKSRTQALDTFRDDPNVSIMLVSINAGGLGLNLTAGSKAYVMEPQFNPAAEAQAVDRVHRLGQRRDVTITRYIMRGSFEEKMLELQRKKKDLAEISMDRDSRVKYSKADLAKQRLEELRSLFR
jgi:SNF2 family DNA or RNA helicase